MNLDEDRKLFVYQPETKHLPELTISECRHYCEEKGWAFDYRHTRSSGVDTDYIHEYHVWRDASMPLIRRILIHDMNKTTAARAATAAVMLIEEEKE